MNKDNPYDPRDPNPEFMSRTNSTHPFHDKIRDCYVLLSIETPKGKIFFVVEGINEWPVTYEELQLSKRYFYEEHTCPTNFIRIPMICFDGDTDPHELFKFEEAIWKIGETHDEEYFAKVFPQLGIKTELD